MSEVEGSDIFDGGEEVDYIEVYVSSDEDSDSDPANSTLHYIPHSPYFEK